MTKKNAVNNRLIHEKSPYLLQHAHNPVDWYPWGDEAFEKAKSEDKPIFLSIGYSTCHWCHVMERESFEDQEVADLLNQYFISIKVDREERPDIDTIYMDVCQALTGHGGWPLTIVMTPEKKPFYAATYLPKHSRQGMNGLMQVLAKLHELWVHERDMLIHSSDNISAYIKTLDENIVSPELSDDILDKAYTQLAAKFDRVYGGFGSQPKFPTPHNLLFLLRYYQLKGEAQALEMVEKTLQSMYQGGIYDHIGFGFARYSTDRYWLVPHFEKMLYDNALLAIVYLEAYQASGKELYARVAREIFTYILRDMTSREGAFFSAEDADSEGVEGKFYVWKEEEIISVLGEEKGKDFCQIYDISKKGNFEGRSIPNLIHGLIDETERKQIEESRAILFNHREKRIHPHKDDKVLTGWNGMMISALAIGARVLNDANYLQAAQRAAAFILNKMRRPDGRLLARYRDGQALYPAYALDYACMVWAMLEIYQSCFDSSYLEIAQELNQQVIEYFWDHDQGGVFFYGQDAESLLTRPKEVYDGAIPSSNSLCIMNFLRLGRISGDITLENKAEQALKLFYGRVKEQPVAYTFFLSAALTYFHPGQEIVIVGDRKDPDSKAFLDKINHSYLPRTLVLFKEDEQTAFLEGIPYVQEMKKINDRATVYLCENNTCLPPISNLDEFNSKIS
jgi:uncharacterized protein YyaL (SSP411 family)